MTIDMTRHQGDQNIPVIECTDTRLQTYRVRTDMQPDTDEESSLGKYRLLRQKRM